MKARIAALALALAAAASAAHAQEQDTTRYTRSIEVGAGSDASIGFWNRSGDQSFGLTVSGALRSENAGQNSYDVSGIIVEPALKLYASGTGPFQPYTYASVFGGIERTKQDDGDREQKSTAKRVGASLAVGMDWFPVERVSIGGRVGVLGSYFSGDDDSDGFTLSTFNSGVLVNLFF